ncbi:MAG: polyhydroxyalkanoate depolymerase [Alphaproteobacteria bacterium]|nr:polyhydroxyalkanoate depolymerase [Alphaproteobacteria bacterium]
MLYHFYDLHHAMVTPARLMAETLQHVFSHPLVPASYTRMGRAIAAGSEIFERATRRHGKPEFGIKSVPVDGTPVAVSEHVAHAKPFCELRHFRKAVDGAGRHEPRVMIVAPMSGHYATLLRDTVAALLPGHDVYITDWINACQVPLSQGRFDLDDYADYIIEFLHVLGPGTHVVAVCQPSVPALAAAAIMAGEDDPAAPASMTLMGGPIDTRMSPTKPNKLAESKPLKWFERSVLSTVPAIYPGAGRKVYPGFLQLTGFMSMNLDRHFGSTVKHFQHLVRGDGDSAQAHRKFYDEYLAVMDLSAEFYLQTIDIAFQRHLLPRGLWVSRNRRVDTKAITRMALMTVEGELDDISGPGQTRAAHGLCANIPADNHRHYFAKGVGHYGIFNGSRWRSMILPELRDFIRQHDRA